MKQMPIIAMLLTNIYVGGVMAEGDVPASFAEEKVDHDQHQAMMHDKQHWTKYPLIEAHPSSSRSRA